MRNFTIISKFAFVVCLCFIFLAVINGFTGFINAKITLSGTAICIVGFCTAIVAIIFLENGRKKKQCNSRKQLGSTNKNRP